MGFFGGFLSFLFGGFSLTSLLAGYGPVNAGYGPVNAGYGPVNAGYGPIG